MESINQQPVSLNSIFPTKPTSTPPPPYLGGTSELDQEKSESVRKTVRTQMPVSVVDQSSASISTTNPTSPTTPLPVTKSVSTSSLTRPVSDSATLALLPIRAVLDASTTASPQLKPLTPSALLLAAQQLPITRTVSQPPLLRTKSATTVQPTSTAHTPGFNTPLPNQSSSHYHHHHHDRAPPILHNLEESYVGKVSLKLGEAVNKIFLPLPAAMLATMGVLAMNHSLVWNGSTAPKVIRAKELGELLVLELHSAVHDVYLLRTLLRSSVLKSLSLCLTRLTALIVPSVQPNPFPLIQSVKEYDTSLPAPFRFNLLIVRCAYEVKEGLRRAGHGLPGFVEETLRPWRDKLDQIIARVMDPVIAVLRGNAIETCRRGRVLESNAPTVASIIPSLPHAAQIRSLSLGRASPAISIETSTVSNGSSTTMNGGGPAWIKDLANVLESTNILFNRLECGLESDKWRASIGTCAVWKGSLALSNRKIISEEPSHPVSTTRSLFKSAKNGTSPPSAATARSLAGESSPPASPLPLPLATTATTTHDAAFVRLLSELELFESRLISFHSTLSTSPSSISDPIILSGKCDAALHCVLCQTGRTFDAESSDEEDSEDGGMRSSNEGLAQSAMREAMQVVSALIVVARASAIQGVLHEALLSNAGSRSTSIPTSHSSPTLVSSVCPTLSHALDTLPTLLLLHLLMARLSPWLGFRLPHQIWSLEWNAYERELRGFAAAEEWTEEIGEEVVMEIGSVLAKFEGQHRKHELDEVRANQLSVLRDAVRIKVGIDVDF